MQSLCVEVKDSVMQSAPARPSSARDPRRGGPGREGRGAGLWRTERRHMVNILTAAIGTAHGTARCCWCAGPLVVNQVEQLRCWTCAREACMRRAVQFALIRETKEGRTCHRVPLPSQCAIYEVSLSGGNVLWGGRAMAAKSVGGRDWLYWRCLTIPGHEALLIRENWDQLRDNHTSKMQYEVPALGGRWMEGDKYAVFGKGSDESVIQCGHMSEASSVFRYRGGNKGSVLADEASLYPVDHEGVSVLAELKTVCRVESVDRAGRVASPVFAATSNPGGPSAPWLSDLFITKTPDLDVFPMLRPVFNEAGEQTDGYRPAQWHYIPATLEQNAYAPEHYRRDNLSGLSATRYKQLGEGDWFASAAQFFAVWDERRHVRRAELVDVAS